MTRLKPWTDDQTAICNDYSDKHADEPCDKYHPLTEIMPERYVFWETPKPKGQPVYGSGFIADFVDEVIAMGPYELDQCVVRDLGTKTTMDAAEFVRKFR